MYTDQELMITLEERNILQELAKQVAAIAAKETQLIKKEKWRNINHLKSKSPVVLANPENGWNEIILPTYLQCKNKLARNWERNFRKQIYWEEQIKDDTVIEPYFNVPYAYIDTGWGVELKSEGGENGGAYHYLPPIKDYERDFPQLKF